MQATLNLSLLPLSTLPTSKSNFLPSTLPKRLQAPKFSVIRAKANGSLDISAVDYGSMTSVFPAEACETTGGEACDVEMFPEAKLKPEAKATKISTVTEQIDREYLAYDSSKTVFLEEACDDLGGEFCKAEFITP